MLPPITGWAPGVTVSYDLGTARSRRYQVKQAEDSARIAHLTTVLQTDQTTLDVTNAYSDLQKRTSR